MFHLLIWCGLYYTIYTLTGCRDFSQYTLAFIHTYSMLVLSISYMYDKSPAMYYPIIKVYMSYFVFDALYIYFCARKYMIYVYHHIGAALVAVAALQGIITPHVLGAYFINIELSNMFVTVYGYTSHKPQYNYINNLALPLLVGTYVPLRTIALSYTTYQMIQDSFMYTSFMLPVLRLVYVGLLLLSYFCSYKIYKIAQKQFKHIANNDFTSINGKVARLVASPDERTFPIIIHIAKMYSMLCYLVYFIPTTPTINRSLLVNFCLFELMYAVVYCLYNILNYRSYYKMIQYRSYYKMIQCGLLHTKFAIVAQNNVIFSIFLYFCCCKSVAIHAVYTLISCNRYTLVGYTVAGGVYTLGIPERYIHNRFAKFFNSVGLTHLILLVADICIAQSIA